MLLIASCQGNLTDEQKKELRDGMIANRITKVTESEIMEAAYHYGKKVATKLGPSHSSSGYQSLENEFHVRIYPLETGDSLLQEIEKQIVEAYLALEADKGAYDNVQLMGNDSLLYTLPVMDTLVNGATEFRFALGIMMPKKEVILSIDKK